MKRLIDNIREYYFLYAGFALMVLQFIMVDLDKYYKLINFHSNDFYHYERMLIIATYIIGFYNLANSKKDEKQARS